MGTQIMADASDDALIDAIADGDRHALEVLYSRHSAGVYRFALRFVADEGIAEDVMNEVFLDVWRKAKSFEGRSQVSTWLLGVARNKALEITRRRRPELLNDEACEAIEDAADDPERAIQRKQNGSILFECLKNLSPVHREIINLIYYHGKSIEEAAQTIRVPRNTVKTRIFYARSHLAKLLVEAGVDTALLQN
jgi:RNA polymerase sigma-70 factor (ECF subfamily)